jgi:hypothetical protein
MTPDRRRRRPTDDPTTADRRRRPTTTQVSWDRNANRLADFDDVRELQRTLQARGLTLASAADESSTGPASLMLIDPDGNPILMDQHVPKPAR